MNGDGEMTEAEREAFKQKVTMASAEYALEQATRPDAPMTQATDWDMAFVKAVRGKSDPVISPDLLDFMMLFCQEAKIPSAALVSAYSRFMKGERINEC